MPLKRHCSSAPGAYTTRASITNRTAAAIMEMHGSVWYALVTSDTSPAMDCSSYRANSMHVWSAYHKDRAVFIRLIRMANGITDFGKTPEQEEGKREVVIWGGSGRKTLGPIGTGVRPPLRSLGMSDFSGCHGVLYFVYSLT